jgi:hypothetical protein
MLLYRPVGLEELKLIYEDDLRRFPARFPDQPFFYPVLTLEYARQIARDWNTKSGFFAGYVIRFEVDDMAVLSLIVGARSCGTVDTPSNQINTFTGHSGQWRLALVSGYIQPLRHGRP